MARQAGYQQKRDAIITATLRVLAEQGYEALTVDEVMAAAHISKGTFYHYFPSKQALVEASLLHISDRVADLFTHATTSPGDDDPPQRLAPLLALTRPYDQSLDMTTRALAQVVVQTASLEAFRTRLYGILTERLTPVVAEALDAGVRAGQFQVADTTATAELLVRLTLSIRARVVGLAEAPMARPGQPIQADRYDDAYLTMIERTLALPAGTFRRDDTAPPH